MCAYYRSFYIKNSILIVGELHINTFLPRFSFRDSLQHKIAQEMISADLSGFSLINSNLCFVLIIPGSPISLFFSDRNRCISRNDRAHTVCCDSVPYLNPQSIGADICHNQRIRSIQFSGNDSGLDCCSLCHTEIRIYGMIRLFPQKCLNVSGNQRNSGRTTYQKNMIQFLFGNSRILQNSSNRIMSSFYQVTDQFFKEFSGHCFLQCCRNPVFLRKHGNLHLHTVLSAKCNFTLLCFLF